MYFLKTQSSLFPIFSLADAILSKILHFSSRQCVYSGGTFSPHILTRTYFSCRVQDGAKCKYVLTRINGTSLMILIFSRALNESLAIPFFVTLLFICIQILHLLVNLIRKSFFTRAQASASGELDEAAQTLDSPATFHYLAVRAKDKDGLAIFGYSVARLLGCFALFALSTRTLFECSDIRPHWTASPLEDIMRECPETFMTLAYVGPSLF